MKSKTLINEVRSDVISFLSNEIQELLFNERDFQMHLAMYLKSTGKYDDVDLEYFVPREELLYYPWNTEIRLDIVVMKNGEFLPIELKYKTKKVECSLTRFEERLKDKYIVIKNQGAQDLGMYDYWKDVCRVEQVRKRFSNVNNGLAIFMTNDEFYLKACSEKANYYQFNMSEGVHDCMKTWHNKEAAVAKSRPEFTLSNAYNIHWKTITIDHITFYYCVTEI